MRIVRPPPQSQKAAAAGVACFSDDESKAKSDYGDGNVIDYAYDAAGNRTSQKVTTAAVPNQLPTANAGSDQIVRLGSLITLNGSGSSDPDNGPSPLSYAWTKRRAKRQSDRRKHCNPYDGSM